LFGSYELTCQECTSDAATSDHLTAASAAVACRLCHYELPKRPESDPFYLKNTRPLMYFCASILPLAYLIGLLFTLRTHVKQIYYSDHKKHDSALLAPAHSDHNNGLAEGSSNTEENTETRDNTPLEDKLQDAQHAHVGGGHDSPEWSKMKSVVILLTCTVLFALLAEQLVQNSKSTADALGISDKFMGLTIFAIVPSFTEFLNAVMFAMYGNIALSLEIGSAYAVQVAMIQIPCVVAYSAWNNFIQGIPDTAETAFTLIFPRWDLYTNFFAVFLLSYTYIEGKANYFKGSVLTLTYLLLLISFYYAEP
jgi:Ca2+:H+ antiporter